MLEAARSHLLKSGLPSSEAAIGFKAGARWMADRLNELSPENRIEFDPDIPFRTYGFIKYGFSTAAFLLAMWILIRLHHLLAPLSIVVFYTIEVHFLFLFPLLLEKHPRPVRESIRMTYRMGLVKTVVKVISIAAFMVLGLFRFRRHLHHWYVGCMAVLIWYRQEKSQF